MSLQVAASLTCTPLLSSWLNSTGSKGAVQSTKFQPLNIFSVKTDLIDKEIFLKEAFWVGAQETMVSEEIQPASYAHHLAEVNEEETSPVVATKYMNKVSRKKLFYLIASCVSLTTIQVPQLTLKG